MQEAVFKRLKHMGYLWLFCRLPAVTYSGESIFEQNYIREQEAKNKI
jgi:hypothetical protein